MIFQQLYHIVGRLVEANDAQITYGREFMGMEPELELIKTIKIDAGSSSYKLGLALPAAKPEFAWLAEITITDQDGGLRHFLLREPNEIVETYGRRVLDVDQGKAQALCDELGVLG
jgi:hypothetical protein